MRMSLCFVNSKMYEIQGVLKLEPMLFRIKLAIRIWILAWLEYLLHFMLTDIENLNSIIIFFCGFLAVICFISWRTILLLLNPFWWSRKYDHRFAADFWRKHEWTGWSQVSGDTHAQFSIMTISEARAGFQLYRFFSQLKFSNKEDQEPFQDYIRTRS